MTPTEFWIFLGKGGLLEFTAGFGDDRSKLCFLYGLLVLLTVENIFLVSILGSCLDGEQLYPLPLWWKLFPKFSRSTVSGFMTYYMGGSLIVMIQYLISYLWSVVWIDKTRANSFSNRWTPIEWCIWYSVFIRSNWAYSLEYSLWWLILLHNA